MKALLSLVLAVALVATALCADRMVAISPQQAQEGTLTQVARRVVVRLTVSFRQAVPGVRIHQARQDAPQLAPEQHH